MISIVCVYNNKKILEDWLLKSLKNQTTDYELILVNNTNNKFKSAAEALNFGGKQAKGEYIMFVHQDVRLESDRWLETAENMLKQIPNLGIAGVAGMYEKGKGKNIIKHGIPPVIWPWGSPIKKPEPVQTLDELLLIIPKKVFNVCKFDEQTCNGWHLYGVDYCLSIKKLGFQVYVLPLFVYHRSFKKKNKLMRIYNFIRYGSLPPDYYPILLNVLRKHRDTYKTIHTTCGSWNTSCNSIYRLILCSQFLIGRFYIANLFNKKFKINRKDKVNTL